MHTDLHADENAYDSLAAAHGGDERWAFGTGFDDPLAGIDSTVPPGLDPAELARECLALGDDALVMSQRLAGWCSNAPELEDEVALANIALDLLGQARLLLARAAQADPSTRPSAAPPAVAGEDALAFFRDPDAFTNVRLAEIEDDGDFAVCIARLFILVTWRLALLDRLTSHRDPVLAAIAGKAVTELSYHQQYAAAWVIRLGDGTALSRERMQAAVVRVRPFVDELFDDDDDANDDDGCADLRTEFDTVLRQVLATATLIEPSAPGSVTSASGRLGEHTDDLASLLAELQSVARAHPDATW